MDIRELAYHKAIEDSKKIRIKKITAKGPTIVITQDRKAPYNKLTFDWLVQDKKEHNRRYNDGS